MVVLGKFESRTKVSCVRVDCSGLVLILRARATHEVVIDLNIEI